MGLDQQWVRMLGETDENGYPVTEEVAYHRKFNALEGFMAEIWYEQNPEGTEAFNCKYLPINEDILNRLEEKLKDDALEPTPGFFFGTYEKDDWYRADVEKLTEEVIPKVRELLKEGEEISYTSWW